MNVHALVEFCVQLGIDKQSVLGAERPNRFILGADVAVDNIRNIGTAQIADLLSSVDGLIDLTIGDPNAPFVHVQKAETPAPQELEKAFGRLRSTSLSSIPVTLDIDKQAILAHLAIDSNDFSGRLFLFQHNLAKILDCPLTTLDTTLFENESKPTIVVVLDTDLLVQGPVLSIVGGKSLHLLPGMLHRVHPRTQQNIDRFRSMRQDLHWDGFVLQSMTPLHLVVTKSDQPPDNPVIEQLANKLIHALIIYSANRTVVNGSVWESVYASPDQQAKICLSNKSTSTEQCQLITCLLRWLQSVEDHQDRLLMFQNVVARELHSVSPSDSYAEFLRRLASILAETRWNYRVHLDGKIDKHFEKMEAAEGYVTSTISEVSKSIDEVTKGFTSSLVTAIGFVVLTLIASLLEDKSRGLIFTIAMFAYGFYLLFFQVLYQMPLTHRGVHLNLDALNVILSPYKDALGTDRIDRVLSPLEKRKQFYNRVFWLTQVLYGGVIVTVFMLGWLLPQQLITLQSGNSLSPPSPAMPVTATVDPSLSGTSPLSVTNVGATLMPANSTPTP